MYLIFHLPFSRLRGIYCGESYMIYLFNTYLISLVSKYATYILSLTN